VVHFTVDGSLINSTVTANSAGSWTFTPSGLSDDAHTIIASQTDDFGNTGSSSLTFILDTTAPAVAITSAGGSTKQETQAVSGTVDVADACTLLKLL
jgi:hypothetical protein